MQTLPDPASAAEAMDQVLSRLSYLAPTDPTAMAAQAECLQGFEQAEAICTAARAWYLGAFTAGQGYSADADYSPTSWLIHRTKVTKGAALGHLGWARRASVVYEFTIFLVKELVRDNPTISSTVLDELPTAPQECSIQIIGAMELRVILPQVALIRNPYCACIDVGGFPMTTSKPPAFIISRKLLMPFKCLGPASCVRDDPTAAM